MYCTYLTIYFGDKLPRRYIGSSSVEKVLNGYNGSVSSIKWKSTYDEEQKLNKHLFKTRILTIHTTDSEAREMEKQLHIKYNVVVSPLYFNESIAIPNGFFGRDVSGSNNPMFGSIRKGEKHRGGENISKALKSLMQKLKKVRFLNKKCRTTLKSIIQHQIQTLWKRLNKRGWKNKEMLEKRTECLVKRLHQKAKNYIMMEIQSKHFMKTKFHLAGNQAV